MSSEQNDEVSDTTGDDSSTGAGNIKFVLVKYSEGDEEA